MIGRTLSHYRIESQLGHGGMGVVYRALDTKLNRPVALKVLPHEAVADPARKQHFVQEARAASALNHPNIITIHDIDTAEGVDFIVMEYVPACSTPGRVSDRRRWCRRRHVHDSGCSRHRTERSRCRRRDSRSPSATRRLSSSLSFPEGSG
jgi:serine/threonine protein kinase